MRKVIRILLCGFVYISFANLALADDSIDLRFDANTELYEIGKIKTQNNRTISIMYYLRIWGQAGRATQRLFFLCNDKYIGIYDVPSKPTLEKGGILDFHVPKEYTGIVEIKSCDLPENFWLDGEIYDLVKAK